MIVADQEIGYRRPGVLGRVLEQAPGVMAEATQVVIDNPGQFLVMGAATVVATRAAANLVRPRSALEAAALVVLLQLLLPKLGKMAVDRGWMTFRVRDLEGRLVPVVPGKVAPDGPVPAP